MKGKNVRTDSFFRVPFSFPRQGKSPKVATLGRVFPPSSDVPAADAADAAAAVCTAPSDSRGSQGTGFSSRALGLGMRLPSPSRGPGTTRG